VSTTPALFVGLLDDAAMFPPGDASPADALRTHLTYRRSSHSDVVGPLLVAAERFTEFRQAHFEAGSPAVSVSLIGTADLPADIPPELHVVGFELPVDVPPLPDPGRSYQVACEVTSTAERSEVLAAVAQQRASGRPVIAKYRTGGTSADAFPSDATLSELLVDAAAVEAPLKFTAGLHSAVRFTNPATGFDHHGFLNLMTAVSRARLGASVDDVRAALAERDPAAVIREITSWTAAEIAEVRAAFVSFGCCGVDEPLADLARLGLLEAELP
jgi:hypothetical protein